MASDLVTIQLHGLDGVLNLLQQLPPEVVSRRGGPVLRALRAGARVIQREAAFNLARATDSLASDDPTSTGLLLKSLVVSRGKQPTGTKGERMLVRVRRKVYQRNARERVSTLKTAQLLEYGSRQQPAEPWLRPAFAAKAPEAIRTVEAALVNDLDRILRRLSKGRG